MSNSLYAGLMVARKRSEKEERRVSPSMRASIHSSTNPANSISHSEREGDGRGVHVTSGEYLLLIFWAC